MVDGSKIKGVKQGDHLSQWAPEISSFMPAEVKAVNSFL